MRGHQFIVYVIAHFSVSSYADREIDAIALKYFVLVSVVGIVTIITSLVKITR